MRYVSISLEERHYREAEETALKQTLRLNHRGPEANLVGRLGEVVFMEYLRNNAVDFTEDLLTSRDLTVVQNGALEVKTKDRTVKPQAYFDGSVSLYNHEHQTVAYWAFVSLQRTTGKNETPRFLERFHHAHLVGIASRKILAEHGVFWAEGQVDPSNNMKFWTDTKNVAFGVLKPVDEAVEIWKARQF